MRNSFLDFARREIRVTNRANDEQFLNKNKTTNKKCLPLSLVFCRSFRPWRRKKVLKCKWFKINKKTNKIWITTVISSFINILGDYLSIKLGYNEIGIYIATILS